MIMPRYVYEWPHAKTWPQLVKGKGKATDGGDGSGGIERWMTTKLTSVQLRQAITKLVVTCDLPFRIVEAEALLILLNRNCAQKNFIPSRWTVSRDTVVYAAAALQSSVAEMPAKEGEVGCRVSFTIDMWTAPNNTAWLVVTGHWIDENFQLRTMVFEFREIHGRHTGKQLARVVEETVVHWGLEKRCLGFTSDNASSNTAAFRWMSEEGGGQCFFNSRMHFRCLAHVINLAVKAALAVAAIRKLLRILREMASWIGFSPQRSGKFLSLQRTLNAQANPAKPKPALKLVQDSPTRWGSTHDMVEQAGVLQEPITVFFAQTQTFLSPFAKVSKAAEGAAYPTVAMVLPYYNGLIDAMESRLAKGPSATLKPMIEAALGLLKKYELMSSNELWIATFLDPSMKAAWFDDAHWETLHPDTDRRARPRPSSGEVIQLVRERVAEYQARAAAIAPRPTPLATVTEEEEGDAADDDEDAEFLPSRRRLAARLSASQEAGRGGMVQDDEVGRYLSERVRCDVSALEYWRSATNMQTLRRMARDYLAIPATSHPGQRIGEGRRAKGEAPPEFAIEGEGEEEDDEWEEEEGEEEQDGVGVGDTTDAEEHGVVGSSSGVQALLLDALKEAVERKNQSLDWGSLEYMAERVMGTLIDVVKEAVLAAVRDKMAAHKEEMDELRHKNEATAVVKERETELTAVRGELAAHKVEVDELHRMLTVLEEKNKATAAVVEERERDLEAVKRELVTVNGELAMVKGELAVVRGGLAECKVAMTEQWVESSRASAVNGLGEKSSKRRRVVTVEKDLELNIELEIRRCTGDRKKALEHAPLHGSTLLDTNGGEAASHHGGAAVVAVKWVSRDWGGGGRKGGMGS
ncbi:unnamed protein product [Closterium sp. NIES-64]|nr:unnamed protein product [Closterium sp. NIES-64]